MNSSVTQIPKLKKQFEFFHIHVLDQLAIDQVPVAGKRVVIGTLMNLGGESCLGHSLGPSAPHGIANTKDFK